MLSKKQQADLGASIARLTKAAHAKTGAGVPIEYTRAERDAMMGAIAATAAAVTSAAEEMARRNAADVRALTDMVSELERKLFGAQQ